MPSFSRYEWSWNRSALRQDADALFDRANAAEDILRQIIERFGHLEQAMEHLQATVIVQQQMLAAAGQLDLNVVEARVEAELDRVRAVPPPPAPDLSAITGTTSSVRCTRCKRDVPANRTVMTGDGPMCDPRCAA
ncbi:MAG TPA: hypothetical protein VGM90_08210 [Kofleriaceae bacterium]|jgi:hypothetical protein